MIPEIVKDEVESANTWFFEEWERILASGNVDERNRYYELLVHERFTVVHAHGGYTMSEAQARCPNISATVGSGDGRIVRKELSA